MRAYGAKDHCQENISKRRERRMARRDARQQVVEMHDEPDFDIMSEDAARWAANAAAVRAQDACWNRGDLVGYERALQSV